MNAKMCPECGGILTERRGKYGNFLGCSNYPRCKHTEKISYQKSEVKPVESTVKPSSEFTPSVYQLSIFNWFKAAVINPLYAALVINAVAGSGKTTTIVKACQFIPSNLNALFLAFNKIIATTLQDRLPSYVKASTFHSLGYSILRKFFGRVEVDNQKIDKFIKNILGDDSPDKWIIQPIKRLVGLCKSSLQSPEDSYLLSLALNFDIDLNNHESMIFSYVRAALDYSLKTTNVIDYDDMLWIPVKLNLCEKIYDFIVIDESQDTNDIQKILVKLCLKDNGKVVFVGDRKQSIYAFRGADSNSMDTIIRDFNASELPLSVSYRCPRAVCSLVNSMFPEIAFSIPENAKLGEEKRENIKNFTVNLKDNDMVLCRCNAPLVKPCFEVIRRGQKAIIKGRDIGQNLVNLIARLKGNDVLDLLSKLDDYQTKESAKYIASNNTNGLQSLEDKIETIKALTEETNTIPELLQKINDIFSDDINGVVFSSVHKAKGLESENVYILRPDLLPHPKAKTEEQIAQESNLQYVAITRSLNTLTWIDGKE